jgi:hypothetical protein
MTNQFKVPYAYDINKNIITIENAIPKQLYYCNCGDELIVKNGIINSKHFAHKNNTNCQPESWLHKECKNILQEYKEITYYDEIVGNNVLLKFDEVLLETQINDFIPDAIGIKEGKRYIIEFCYTNEITETKLKKIKKANIFTMEIYIRYLPTNNRNELINELLYSNTNTSVVYNPYYKKDQIYQYLTKKNQKQINILKAQHSKIKKIYDSIEIKNILRLDYKETTNEGIHIFNNLDNTLQCEVNADFMIIKRILNTKETKK